MAVTTTPLSPTIGIEVAGRTGPELVDPAVAEHCRAALDRHGVVVYREVHISDADLVAFSRLLGQVVVAQMGNHPTYPEISPITRDPGRSALAAYRGGTFFWHLDGTTADVPEKATLLTARVVAEDDDGDTEFANTYAAYEALPDDEKARIADLRVRHSFAAAQLKAEPDATPDQRAQWERRPANTHPLVWKRGDGRRSLLLGATADHVVGLDPDEGRALLDRLLAWATQPAFVIRHHWRRGDLVVFDNTGLLHRALPYGAGSARLMHRTTLAGEEQVA
jgi:alpha-ketoglutarate-dependent taurine dioxygenase